MVEGPDIKKVDDPDAEMKKLNRWDRLVNSILGHLIPLVLTLVITVPSVWMAMQRIDIPQWLIAANGSVIATYFKGTNQNSNNGKD